MRRRLTKKEYVLTGVFAFVAAFPLATSSAGVHLSVEPLASLTQRLRLQVADDQREHEQMIARVRELCEKRIREHPGTVCPDVNDKRAVYRFLHGIRVSTETGSGTVTASGSLRMPKIDLLDLGQYEQALLRRFQRAGRCPADLDHILPGFQRLCDKEVEASPRMLRLYERLH